MLKLRISIVVIFMVVITSGIKAQAGFTSGASVFCDSLNSGFISLNNFTGTILKWQYTINHGSNWIDISNPTSTQSYNNLKKTTGFRAIVKNGFLPADTSTVCIITVQVKGETGVLQGGGVFCGETGNGIIKLTGFEGNVFYWESSVNNGLTWTLIANTTYSQSYNSILQSTRYRAIVNRLPACPKDTTPLILFTIHKKTNAGLIFGGDSLCANSPGDTLKLKNNVGSIVDWFSSVNNGANWTSLGSQDTFIFYPEVTKTVLYKATVKNEICNTETTTPAVVAVYKTNPANAGEDKEITQYQSVVLNGSGNGTPSWSPSVSLNNAGILQPLATPINTTGYVLTIIDSHSCSTSDEVIVRVIIPIPTAITPNNDNVNDFFTIDKIETYPENTLTLYNRWGNIVYKAGPYKNEWNGKSGNGQDLPDDIYFYILDYGNGEKALTNYILIKR